MGKYKKIVNYIVRDKIIKKEEYIMLNHDIKERERYVIWRKRRNIKLSDVAKHMGISIAAVSMWERYLIDFRGNKEDLYIQYING